MSKKKQEQEYESEKQIIGWEVYVDTDIPSPYHGYISYCIKVTTKERAEELAVSIANGKIYKAREDERFLYFRDLDNIKCVRTQPRTRTIYIKK